MNLAELILPEIKNNLGINRSNLEYTKIVDASSVLNIAYLKLASEEIKYAIRRNPSLNRESKFDYLMRVYNKSIREHQIMFLLLNIFETALRSKAAYLISENFSKRSDDWWKDITVLDKSLVDPISKAVQQLNKTNFDLSTANTFDLFDTFTFGQLERIYDNYWNIFQSLFQEKAYRSFSLSKITKNNFKTKMNHIRLARNNIAHHKPIDYSKRGRQDLIHDIEFILRHLNFNLEDAINQIDPQHSIVNLKYTIVV